VVNFGNIDSFGTIEYRQHQQTYHVATVQNWVRLMHRLTSRCWVQETKNIDPRDFSLTIDGFADYLGLGQNRLRAWMRRRANYFGFGAIARPRDSNRIIGINQRGTDGNNRDSVIDAIEDELRRERETHNAPFTLYDHNRLYEQIVLVSQNYEPVTTAIREFMVDNFLDAENLKRICLGIPRDQLPEYDMENWNQLNWNSIRSEIVEVMRS